MTSTLPPDPYKCLGVSKDASLPEIRSAHRKLVLKCHPDKVQDAALKAIKQDEFQKVQQAYELLSDDAKRIKYDEQVKLFELRKEMGRGNPTPRSNPFEFEVRNADPRPSSYGRPSPKVYSYPTGGSRSHEDMMYDEPMRHIPRKSSSAEYADRKRPSARDAEREREHRRRDDEDRLRSEKESKRAHSEKKKSKDKEKRSRTEEATRARAKGVYVEDDSSDEYPPRPRSSGKRERQKMDEHIRAMNEETARREAEYQRAEAKKEARAQIKEAPLAEKWDAYRDAAAKYMQSARLKGTEEETFHPRGPQRSETFTGGSPSAFRYTSAPAGQFSDEDVHRRSSGRKPESRRTSETPPVRSREKLRGDRRSPSHIKTDGYVNIVEPPSPPPPTRFPPPLQSFSSAPPTYAREKPSRSKTQDYPRKEKVPPLSRAQTFEVDDRDRDRPRERGGSRLRKGYTSSSDDEEPIPVYSPRVSQSPPPMMRSQKTRYVVENGRTIPIPVPVNPHRHRESHEEYSPRQRDLSPSPRIPRPSLSRNPPNTRDIPTYSSHTNGGYYPKTQPIVVEGGRPKMPGHEGSTLRASSRNVPAAGSFPFENVSYSPAFGQENIRFANPLPLRTAAPDYHRGREGVYVS